MRLSFWLAFLVVLSGCQKITNDPPKGGKTLIAFGDSLTAGEGARAGQAYPDFLSERLGQPVLNRGISGNTTGEALARIETDVLAEDPRLVIVWLGANDELRQIPKQEAMANLAEIVDRIQQHGALVVLVGIPDLPFRPSYNDGIVELAKVRGCVLVSGPLKGILTDPSLKSDQIHPNSAGYRIVADRIAKKIGRYASQP